MFQQDKYLEIERRWLLKDLPGPEILDIPSTVYSKLNTVYIIADPELEVRIRRREDIRGLCTFSAVMKIGSGLIRQESEKLEATSIIFNHYLEDDGKFLAKEHWKVKLQCGRKLKLSLFRAPAFVEGLILAEIEFKNLDEANRFSQQDFPDWFKPLIIEEVTVNTRYNGKNLAVHGRPNPI